MSIFHAAAPPDKKRTEAKPSSLRQVVGVIDIILETAQKRQNKYQGLTTTFCHEETKKAKTRSLFLYFSFVSSKNFEPS